MPRWSLAVLIDRTADVLPRGGANPTTSAELPWWGGARRLRRPMPEGHCFFVIGRVAPRNGVLEAFGPKDETRMTSTTIKKVFMSLTAGLGGLFCAMGADCLPDPPPIPVEPPCTAADIIGDCEGGVIIGSRRYKTCACSMLGGSITLPDGSGSGTVKMSLAAGWSFGGTSGGIPTIALAGRDEPGGPVSMSPSLHVTDTEFSPGRVEFAVEDLGAGFHTISEMSQTAVHVQWGGPLTVTLTNPSGATVEATLPDWALLPVTVEDDCEILRFEGEVSQGPVTVEFKAEADSPGCD